MMNVERILRRPRLLRATTSLDQGEFARLLVAFEAAWTQATHGAQALTSRGTVRQRALGAGSKGVLPTAADKLLFILFYFKGYPIQEVMGMFFGFSQQQASEWAGRLTPVLNAALGYEKLLPARDAASLETLLAREPDLRELLLDGTERPIRRPKDTGRRKRDYSGKKKRHGKKNVVVTARHSRQVVFLSPTRPAREHDKKVADEAGLRFPEGASLFQDTGLQGYAPPGAFVFQPKKKPRGRELSPERKLLNKAISQVRVGVEHAIAGVKRCHIVAAAFRGLRAGLVDAVMAGACGLHNLRCAMRGQAAAPQTA